MPPIPPYTRGTGFTHWVRGKCNAINASYTPIYQVHRLYSLDYTMHLWRPIGRGSLSGHQRVQLGWDGWTHSVATLE
uniref:Uncharacterized protein n=1 Tax=Xenopus tropicalis TaxID=8364 RepID=A0A1B8Y0G4_XENTR